VSENRLPLEGYTVLDLTQARAGPTSARVLADWGANVIYIEPPATSGKNRVALTGQRDGFDFQNLHRNKRSLTIDLKNPEGHALFMKLAAKADVITENFRSEVKHRLGIDYDSVAKVNDRIVYGSIAGFGQDGPYGKRPGVDQIAQGMGGLMSITGLPGQGPVRVGIPITDLCAGMFLAQGILIALLDREKTGKGQWVHTSLLESMTFMLDFQASRWLQKGEIAPQAGNDHPINVPMGCFETETGLINIAASGTMFERFCKVANAENLLEDPKFNSVESRSDNRAALNDTVSAILKQQPAEHWIEVLNDAGVPCGPVYSINETFEDPQVKHLEVVRQVDHPRLGKLDVVRQPVNLTATPQPQTLRYATPDVGEHSDVILGEMGLSADEIAKLRDAGAI
jgi:crotonobetainyl-CoA:carnitine CoA-transferase CaiB-like acyl-CoA transferase